MCAAIVYDDNLSTGSGAIPSPRTSPYPPGGDYVAAAANGQLPDYSQAGYVHFPPSCEAWAATIPAPAPAPSAIPSNVSSPSPSSSVTPDDFTSAGGHYLPTSAPMMPSSSSMGLRGGEEIKMEYVDGNGMYKPFVQKGGQTELSETDLIVFRPWVPGR